MKQQNDQLSQRLAKEDEQNQQLQSDLKVVTDKLNVTQEDLQKARQQSKASVAAYNKKLTGLEINVNTQLATKASAEDVNKLGGDVTGVKNDLEDTKSKLERATGDMGVMSGLIARNHDDLEELKRKGDRNYYEFTLQKSKTPQRVGPVQISLSKADQKRSKYTVTVLADDKSIEKKDKTAGEPVQFYVKGTARYAPYELVVFDVGKNQVTGYLSTPKSGGSSHGREQHARSVIRQRRGRYLLESSSEREDRKIPPFSLWCSGSRVRTTHWTLWTPDQQLVAT